MRTLKPWRTKLNLQKFTDYIFKNYTQEQVKMATGLTLSFLATLCIYSCKSSDPKTASVPEELEVNLSLMIPENHLLYSFEASNFDNIEPLLEAFNMVQVYNPLNGQLLAKNIKLLRAPKDPSQLAFVIPVNIANKLAPFGLEFKIAVQKNTKSAPVWALKTKKSKTGSASELYTFGE